MTTTNRRNRPAETASGHPVLQWHNGKTTARNAAGRYAEGFVGFTVEAGRSEEFDAAAGELAVKRVQIKHRREGGFEEKWHWSLGELTEVYPLTPGPLTTTVAAATRQPETSARNAALLATWGDDGSRLSLWCLPSFGGLIHPIPVILSVRSRMTDRLYEALLDHLRICEQADALAGRTVMPWELALPLGPGEQADFGKAQQTTVTPLVSRHPATLTNEALADLALPTEMTDYAAQLVDDAAAWALAELTRLQTPA